MASPAAAHRFLERLTAAADGARDRLLEVWLGCGLNSGWYNLLRSVAAQGETGCSQTDLAARLGLAESSVCGLVDKLQREGLLHRFRSKHDRRRSLLLLSDQGTARFNSATAATEAALMTWLSDASDEELNQITGWLELLAERTACGVPMARDFSIDPPSAKHAPQHPRIREAG